MPRCRTCRLAENARAQRPPAPGAARAAASSSAARPRDFAAADRQGLRRPHARRRRAGAQPVGRQPAEVHRRPRDPAGPGRAGRRRSRPGASMPARPPRSTRRCSTLAANGAAILVISQDLDELLELTDRLAVINDGRAVRPARRPPAPRSSEIGLLMGGAHGMASPNTARRPAPMSLRLEPRRERLLAAALRHAGARGGADHARRASSCSRPGLQPARRRLTSFFISPLIEPSTASAELGVKAAPLVTDRGRPRHRLPRQCLEHRRRGPVHHGRDRRRRRRRLRPGGQTGRWILPLMLRRRHPGRHGLGGDPGLPQDPVQRQRDPDQPDADLCRDAAPQLPGPRPLEGPRGLRLPAVAHVHRRPRSCRSSSTARGCISACLIALAVAVAAWVADDAHAHRLRDQGRRPGAARRALRRLRPQAGIDLALPAARRRPRRARRHCSRWRARSARSSRLITPGYGFTAIIVAFLGRLHPLGILLGRPADGAVLHRRRERRRSRSACRRRRPACSRACCCSSCSRSTSWSATASARIAARAGRSPPHEPRCRRPDRCSPMISAATPLLLAGIGELVVETLRRAQSRRRGHDARRRGHRLRGRRRHRQRHRRHPGGAALAGMLLALIFGVLTLTLRRPTRWRPAWR